MREHPYTVRPGTSNDLPRIAEIYNEAVRDGHATFDDFEVSGDRYTHYMEEQPGVGLVCAMAHDEVVGWATVDPVSDRHAYRFTGLGSLYVSRRHRGKGVGKLMLQAMDSLAVSLGYHSILGEILSTNPASVAMDISHGYRVVGEIYEAGFRNGRWIGLIVVQKVLT